MQLLRLICILCLGTSLLFAQTPADEAKNETVLFEENFEKQLGHDWSWLREDRDAWRMEDGALEIKVLRFKIVLPK